MQCKIYSIQERMKAKLTHWYNALAATLLSLLGFSSCGENGLGGGGECLYGTPTSTFQVKGNVTDEEGTPIQGIKTKVEVKYGGWAKDSIAYTDSKGNYLLGNLSSRLAKKDLSIAAMAAKDSWATSRVTSGITSSVARQV